MITLSHYPTGWRVIEQTTEKDAKGNDGKVTRFAHCLSFPCHLDAIAYMAVVHPEVTITFRCECCGKAKALEPEAVGSTFMLNCAGCRSVPATYSPPSDAEIGKPMKKPRPGLKETHHDFLAQTLREVRHFEMQTTGHPPLDRELKLPWAPKEDNRFAMQDVTLDPDDVPDECQVCNEPVTDALVDGVIRGAGWAFMCPKCHKELGIGLGTGMGQLYEKQDDGLFHRTQG